MLTSNPLRVAVLCSRRAPGLAHLLSVAPAHERRWTISRCITSETTFDDEALVRSHGVPVIHHPLREFRDQIYPGRRLSDMALRRAYDRCTVDILRDGPPDLIVLAGYLLLLTEPMLDAFPSRILNVHHSDLFLRTQDGAPKYPGLRAVRDAILAGELETRSTVHLVNGRLDGGPPLARSHAYPVSELTIAALENGERTLLKQEIRAHEGWMLKTAFGPLMERALDMLSAPVTHAQAS